MNRKLLVWMLVLILCLEAVLGLGIRPAKTTIIYEETPVYAGKFVVVNNDHLELDLALSVSWEI